MRGRLPGEPEEAFGIAEPPHGASRPSARKSFEMWWVIDPDECRFAGAVIVHFYHRERVK
jgi:hypothetical protein